MSESRTKASVVFPMERGVPEWEERHRRGEVPGRWPYGLEGLERSGATVVSESAAEPSRLRTLINAVVPAPARDRSTARRVAISWDENTARRMYQARRHREFYSGVIWLTDLVAANGSSPYQRLREVLRHFDGLWTLSRAQLEPLARFLGTDSPPVHFVRFGVDEAFFTPAPYPKRPLVLSVGGDRDRDTTTLFAACELILDHRPDAQVIVQTSSSVAAPAGVRTVPHLKHLELAELYRRASVVTIATRPNLHVSGMTVSLEAMATARPVVISESPGMGDYVKDGRTGLLAPAGDAAALASHTLTLLDDPQRASEMGERGRAEVEAGMTTRHLAGAIAELAKL